MGKPSESKWLQRTPSTNVAGRVFCIPQAGCGTSVFGKWPDVWNSIEFLPVELPGRLARFGDRMPATFQELAEDTVAGLAPYLDVPFAFFGHCWGALAAYEASSTAERGGRRPVRLFVSADLPPHEPRTNAMNVMTEDELAAEVARVVRAFGKEPHPELMSIYVKILRDDMGVRLRYVASRPLRLIAPLTVVSWTEDDEVPPDQVANWADCGDATFELLPGDHNRFGEAPTELLDLITSGMKVT